MPYFDGTDPCWIPDAPYGSDKEWRFRLAKFGDGYQQRILDGINALERTFRVTFQNRTADVLKAMDEYLISQQGAAFPFLDVMSGVTYSVWCDKWSTSFDVKRKRNPITWKIEWYGSLQADFVQANGILIGPITTFGDEYVPLDMVPPP